MSHTCLYGKWNHFALFSLLKRYDSNVAQHVINDLRFRNLGRLSVSSSMTRFYKKSSLKNDAYSIRVLTFIESRSHWSHDTNSQKVEGDVLQA
jgi:hypothetical protein